MQQPMGTLDLTVQGNMLTASPITPSVTLNGQPVSVGYGQNLIPVYAGPLRVEVSCQWLRRYGQAALDVQVPPGGVVPVSYAAPMHQFTTGSIGPGKQTRKGRGFMVVLLLVVLALVVLLSIAAL